MKSRGSSLGQWFGVSVYLFDSRFTQKNAHVAQLVEHVLGKDEVTRSIRVVGSKQSWLDPRAQ